MKRFSFLGMIGVSVMLHTTAVAKQATVMMPQVGTQVVSVEPGDTLTYLDFKGYGKITATASNSAYATTIFRPAQEGYTIYIDFDTVHVSQIANNAPTCLKVYNGVFDTLSVTYPADYKRRPSDSSSITFVNRPSVEAQPAEFGAKAPVSSQIENAGLVAVLTQQLQLLGKIVEQKDAEIERYKRLVENLEAENAALRNNVKKAKSNTVRMEQNVKKAPVEESDDEDTFYQA